MLGGRTSRQAQGNVSEFPRWSNLSVDLCMMPTRGPRPSAILRIVRKVHAQRNEGYRRSNKSSSSSAGREFCAGMVLRVFLICTRVVNFFSTSQECTSGTASRLTVSLTLTHASWEKRSPDEPATFKVIADLLRQRPSCLGACRISTCPVVR